MDKQAVLIKKEELKRAGWDNVSLGCTRSNGKIKPVKGFLVFVRDREFDDFLKSRQKQVQRRPVN